MGDNKMNNIKFSHNWNQKLNQKIFTTIRSFDTKKWNYYKGQENEDFTVLLKGVKHSIVTLISVETEKLGMLPKGLICADTGNKFEDAMAIFKRFGLGKQQEAIVLTFVRKEK